MSNMNLYIRRAEPDSKPYCIKDMAWCHERHLQIGGFPYTDELINADGIHLEIIAPEGTAPALLERAIKIGRNERDVVRHSVLLCPKEWFDEAGFVLQAAPAQAAPGPVDGPSF